MDTTPIIIERVYNSPATRVWKALTDKEEIKQWSFVIESFEPVVGFEFQFYGEHEGQKFLHLCKVLEVIKERKLTYTWKYDDDPAVTVVSYELFPEGDKTRIRLTHTGVEKFSADKTAYRKDNFIQGWTSIIGTNLKDFVEKS